MAMTAITKGGRVISALADPLTQAMVATDDIHEAIHAGDVYQYDFNVSAGAGASGAFFFYTGSAYENHMRIVGIATSADKAYITLYEYQGTGNGSGGFASSGYSASATSVNRNRTTAALRASAGDVTYYSGSGFITTSATFLDKHFIGGGTGVGGAKSGGGSAGEEEFPLAKSKAYALHYYNGSSGENIINIRTTFRHYDD